MGRKERGKVHICSRTLIFEPERQELPLQKYFYKYWSRKQTKSTAHIHFHLVTVQNLQFVIGRVVEIQTQGPPSPYIYHDEISKEIVIQPLYESATQVNGLIERIMQINDKSHDIENVQLSCATFQEVTSLILEKTNKLKFNMSFLESISEKPLVQRELYVRMIMPLIQTQGSFLTIDSAQACYM